MGKGSALLVLCEALLALAVPSLAQQDVCRADITQADGYKIRSASVQARWGAAPQVNLPFVPGETFSPEHYLDALEAVQKAIKSEFEEERGAEFKLRRAFSVLYVDVCVKADDAAKVVDIIVRPFIIRVDLQDSDSRLLLPRPRSSSPTFFSQLPRPLVAFDPQFGLDHDDEKGVSQSAGFSTNLLDLSRILQNQEPSKKDVSLQLEAKGSRSLNQPFYESELRLSLNGSRPLRRLEGFSASAGFVANSMPQGAGKKYENVFSAGGDLQFRLRLPLVRNLHFGMAYRRASNRFADQDAGVDERMEENAFEFGAVTSGRAAGGLLRAGLWADAASSAGPAGSYQRLAVLGAYHKEIVIAPSQTLGIEAVAGFGRVWDAVPEHARFFGGGEQQDFLYKESKGTVRSMPAGPLVRSLGSRQAAVAGVQGSGGGKGYWHFNLDFAIPVPKWSRPLIPNVDVNGSTLKGVLKRQLGSAESFALIASSGRTEPRCV